MLAVTVFLIVVSVGCATAPPVPKTITSIDQIVGWWIGWNPCRGCSTRFRANLSIQADGYWVMVVEQNASFHGKVAIVNGALQWGAGGWWYGPVRVVEEGGREWLTFVRENGEVWTEFDRAK